MGAFLKQGNKRALERLSAGQEAVESSLQARLLEALNSEVLFFRRFFVHARCAHRYLVVFAMGARGAFASSLPPPKIIVSRPPQTPTGLYVVYFHFITAPTVEFSIRRLQESPTGLYVAKRSP